MKLNKLKIGIIGSGSVGAVFATMLIPLGYDIEVVDTVNKHIVIDNKINFFRYGVFGTDNILVKIVNSINDFSSKKDLIFVLSDAPHLKPLSDLALNYLTPIGRLILLNNLFTINEIVTSKNINKLVGLFFDFSCKRDNTNVNVYQNGDIYIGEYYESSSSCNNCKLLSITDVANVLCNITRTHICKEFVGFITGRILLNMSINSLCALTGLNLGKVLNFKKGKKIFIDIIKESCNTFYKLGINILPYNYQLNYRLFCQDSFYGRQYQKRTIKNLIKNNYFMSSSILFAIANGYDCEIDFGIGKVVMWSKKLNVNAELCEKIYSILTSISKGETLPNVANLIDKNLCKNYCNSIGEKNDN